MNTSAAASLVAVRLPPGPTWLRTVDDIWAAGDAVAPLPTEAPAALIDQTLRVLRPSALIDRDGTAQFDDGVPVDAGTAAVIATSGSTATPKAAVLTADALHACAAASLNRLAVTADDRWLSCLPLQHVGGFQVVVRSRLMGVAPVMHERFSVDAVAAQRDVTLVALVPTMLRRLLDAGADLRHIRCVLLGGAAPGPQLLADAAAAGLQVVSTYGMTETAGGCVYDGRPLDGVDVAVDDDDDRIRIRGAVLFSGYRLDDERSAQVLRDGWFLTDDLGRWADQGRLEVLGRADDVIITGGQKVGATWLAGVLERHPSVREAAVIARGDPQWGQRVVAVIVPRGAPPSLEDLRAFVQGQASSYAAPHELVVIEALPRLASGKVDRLALR